MSHIFPCSCQGRKILHTVKPYLLCRQIYTEWDTLAHLHCVHVISAQCTKDAQTQAWALALVKVVQIYQH